MGNVVTTLERKNGVYKGAATLQPYVAPRAGRLAEAVHKRSRVAGLLARVELANSALVAAVELAFDMAGEVYPNVDIDGRVNVILPWTRGGAAAFGLRTAEQRCLRTIMAERARRPGAVFLYLEAHRGWYLAGGFTPAAAMDYARRNPVTIDEWHAAWERTQTAWAGRNLGKDAASSGRQAARG